MRNKKKELPLIRDIRITDAGAEGKALGHWEDKVVFLRNAVPGDVVDIQLTRQKKNYCEGRLVNISSYSPHREEPFCRHFGICGGCRWQNMKYEQQLHFKQKMVEDQLRRIGKLEIEDWQPILGSPLIRHYRNKMEYSFSNVRYLTREDEGTPEVEKNMNALGFHVAPTFFRVLDLRECFLPPPLSDQIRLEVRKYALENRLEYYDLREHRGYLRNMFVRSTSQGDWMLIMVFAGDDKGSREALLQHMVSKFPELTSVMYVINNKKNDIISDLPVHLFHGKDHMMESLDGIRFRIGPVSFFQTNGQQVLNLYRLVAEWAGIQPHETVYDLYTGTGTIANYIAGKARAVIGIEYVESAVEDARLNSELNGITNTHFFAGDMHRILTPEFIAQQGRPDLIITDPPRAGMHEKVVEQILDCAPQRIVYVSCNSATQARDAALMKDAYRIVRVRAVDMFPHTQHVESVMLLIRKDC